MSVIKKHEASSSDASRQRISRLPHDKEDNGYSERTERRRHSTVCDIGNIVGNVGVADVLEKKFALVSDKPASEGEQELSEGRMDIEEVGSLQVVRSKLYNTLTLYSSLIQLSIISYLHWQCYRLTYLSKVHFIKDNLVRMGYAPESCDECKYRQD